MSFLGNLFNLKTVCKEESVKLKNKKVEVENNVDNPKKEIEQNTFLRIIKKKISLWYRRFPLGLFHSKSFVVGSCIYNGKDVRPCIVTIKMVTKNILTLLP